MRNQTHDTNATLADRAVLVSLYTNDLKLKEVNLEYSLAELVGLAETAGVEVLDTITQNKDTKDPKWFIGKGKVEELKLRIDELGATTAIFDQELSGAQVRNLEAALDVKIIDRTQLILDIFAGRAKTREGIVQVELAQLSYLLPRLSGQGKNLSRLGGGIGTRGPGETKLETDRRHIRDRINELKGHLHEMVRHRTLHRERRKKTGIFQVALVGYTNAGKSTLLKQLTQADVLVENQLFATLDPTSRNLMLPAGKEIVLTDTVGFIQNLPHDLVAAFRATLEEANEADLILHIVDSSSDNRSDQMKVVQKVLEELGASGKEQMTVFNKIDLCSPEEREMLTTEGEYIKINAYSPSDLDKLKEAVQERMTGDTLTFRIPSDRGDLAAHVYRIGEVLEQSFDESDILYNVRINRLDYEKLGYVLEPYTEA
ncbi:GTP-binding protein HflX [Paenibacillus swuensis]|uniref:GTPase HflX n=1 Tax=Paenibacillus swuensis TaxID=1178515 RepID=A0A172TLD9_9BACL|nr:GTPase HflX [Paenibacillus swuensis]ANE47875.1 GTP-binding protein HflX [Paenibacillus swuensis]